MELQTYTCYIDTVPVNCFNIGWKLVLLAYSVNLPQWNSSERNTRPEPRVFANNQIAFSSISVRKVDSFLCFKHFYILSPTPFRSHASVQGDLEMLALSLENALLNWFHAVSRPASPDRHIGFSTILCRSPFFNAIALGEPLISFL
jgi:hypothetical protein